ncbi:hypothetical protein EPUS_02888 [Endocarpon pusillum Z07020]|uniref:Uncharacterized protein n=1 Tax=Endocarpon pusillum (strain Z07020 / HMAS-L-300199) TaxID=1263415 RepID=U1G468_ENDPU|nr:uncharacterized protein EPUS_02888 [Endocarpon pusillum Z07020]ERF72097.1 hypothetical protein EPUS_02888 [Endocarpon pusillum Z07020]
MEVILKQFHIAIPKFLRWHNKQAKPTENTKIRKIIGRVPAEGFVRTDIEGLNLKGQSQMSSEALKPTPVERQASGSVRNIRSVRKDSSASLLRADTALDLLAVGTLLR